MITKYISLKNLSFEKISEEELILGLKNREKSTFEYLVKNYSYALKKIFDKSDVRAFSEDLLQETFIKIWQKIDLYDTAKGRLFTWMTVVARYTANNFKAGKIYKKSELTCGIDNYIDVQSCLIDQDNYLDINTDLVSVLELAHKYAPAHTSLINYYLQGYHYIEIGRLEGLGMNVANYRIRQSLIRIRQALSADLFHLGKPLEKFKPRKVISIKKAVLELPN